MTVYEIEVKREQCIYCKKWIEPNILKNETEIRKLCPYCNLTIEVIRKKKVI